MVVEWNELIFNYIYRYNKTNEIAFRDSGKELGDCNEATLGSDERINISYCGRIC